MLIAILDEFHRKQGSLCADEIAGQLDLDRSAVEGMLEMLVHMGKLVEIGGLSGCEACSASPTCLLISPSRRAYAIPTRET